MRILHTADWHLNDRLHRVSRRDDITARLREIAGYLGEYKVDVLVVAGDLFSQHSRSEELRDAVGDVNQIFKPFLLHGGTIVAISGNHDDEALFNLLRFTLDLAAPIDPQRPGPRPRGRLYLASEPTYLLLEDMTGQQVQFVLLPYPSAARYLRDEATRYNSLDEKNHLLHQALLRKLSQIEQRFINPCLPSVLVSHIHVRGSHVHNLYHISEREDVIFEPGDIPTHWAYVAYGHIHKPQALPGTTHVRYAGSIERFDYAERNDDKSVVLIEVGAKGRVGEPSCLPLSATPIYHIEISDPETDLQNLQARYAEAQRALASYRLVYKPGQHNRDEICRQIEMIFPRWYRREIVAEGAKVSFDGPVPAGTPRDVPATVHSYLRDRLADSPDRQELMALADELLASGR